MILTAPLFICFFFISAESNSQQERSCTAPFKPQVANHGEMQHVLVLFNSLGSTEPALQRCAEHGSSGSFRQRLRAEMYFHRRHGQACSQLVFNFNIAISCWPAAPKTQAPTSEENVNEAFFFISKHMYRQFNMKLGRVFRFSLFS